MSEREKRARSRKFVRRLNNIGKRLKWVRRVLGLYQKEVALEADIPMTTYFDREEGVRTGDHEEILVIAHTLNKRWQSRFGDGPYPEFDGKQVKSINVMWVMFGGDPEKDEMEQMIADLQIYINEKEQEHGRDQLELKRQLSLFADQFAEQHFNS